MAKVLRAFDYSFDGVTLLHANVDDDIDFGDLSAGLAGENFIEACESSAVTPEPVVETVIETVTVTETVATPVVETVVTPVVETTPTTPAPAPKTRTHR